MKRIAFMLVAVAAHRFDSARRRCRSTLTSRGGIAYCSSALDPQDRSAAASIAASGGGSARRRSWPTTTRATSGSPLRATSSRLCAIGTTSSTLCVGPDEATPNDVLSIPTDCSAVSSNAERRFRSLHVTCTFKMREQGVQHRFLLRMIGVCLKKTLAKACTPRRGLGDWHEETLGNRTCLRV
jgi:hypothetical protein